jgi:hypothetical protein
MSGRRVRNLRSRRVRKSRSSRRVRKSRRARSTNRSSKSRRRRVSRKMRGGGWCLKDECRREKLWKAMRHIFNDCGRKAEDRFGWLEEDDENCNEMHGKLDDMMGKEGELLWYLGKKAKVMEVLNTLSKTQLNKLTNFLNTLDKEYNKDINPSNPILIVGLIIRGIEPASKLPEIFDTFLKNLIDINTGDMKSGRNADWRSMSDKKLNELLSPPRETVRSQPLTNESEWDYDFLEGKL